MMSNGASVGVWLPVALVGVITCLTPALTAPTLQFGVRIPPQRAQDPVVRQQRRAYFWRVGVLAACLLAIAVLVPITPGWGTVVNVAVQLAGSLGCYFLARERIIAAKEAGDWFGGLRQSVTTDTSWRTEPERFPWLWLAPALAVIAAAVVVGIQRYPDLPAQLPTHFNASGVADQYAGKSVGTAFALVFTQIFVTALITGLLWVTYRSRPEVDAADPVASTQRYRTFLRTMGRAMLLLAALVDVTLLLIALQTWGVYHRSPGLVGLVALPVIAGVVVIVAVAVRLGQGGFRLARGAAGPAPAGAATGVVNRDDDQYWKGGLFYVNRRDPAIIVGRRFGVGWTLNFGNPVSWLVFVVIIGAAAGLVVARRS
jgi:uncharacterized membrane protein